MGFEVSVTLAPQAHEHQQRQRTAYMHSMISKDDKVWAESLLYKKVILDF